MDKLTWFDTHCHLQDEAFDKDREEVFLRAKEAGIKYILLSTSNYEDSKIAIDIALQNEGVFCAMGCHPQDVNTWNDDSVQNFRDLYEETAKRAEREGKDNPIKAIGEIGLDYHWDTSQKEKQKIVYQEQIKLAHELKLPLIIHERDAFQDSYQILQWAYQHELLAEEAGVCHCFSGSWESAELVIKLGFLIGLDGPVTFKNAKKPKEIAQRIDLNKLIIETDSPYLTPEPNRGKRNESAYIPHIGKVIAEIRNVEIRKIADVTTANGKRLFSVK